MLYFTVQRLICTVVLLDANLVRALVTGNVKIVSGGGLAQFLPGSYINTFPRWTLENASTPLSSNLKRLVGTGVPSRDDGIKDTQQFAVPFSVSELWWPSDIDQIQIRPTLDVMIKSGIAAYVLAGIDVRIPPFASGD